LAEHAGRRTFLRLTSEAMPEPFLPQLIWALSALQRHAEARGHPSTARLIEAACRDAEKELARNSADQAIARLRGLKSAEGGERRH
jgi:hypothetical protein